MSSVRFLTLSLATLVAANWNTSVTGTPCACAQLESFYPDKLLFPSSAKYTVEATSYWDIRSDLHPSCIFLPTTAEEVANAVKILTHCDAHFAVRGGGHMNFPGANNIDNGVLIALPGMDQFTVHNETIDVGPGMTWYDVYSALDPYGRIAIGGRLKTIGVPGLTLIGGVHYFINKYGFAMDNVVRYEVVLGNGTQVVASANSHPDLFWALKGGANNFAIVTKFTLKTFAIPKISTTIQSFNESGIYDYITALCDLVKLDEPNPIAAGGVFTIDYNATTKVSSASLIGVQEGVSRPPSQFTNFTAIPGVSKAHNVTTGKQFASGLVTPNQMFRVMFSHHTVQPDPETLYSIYQAWKTAVDEIADVKGLYPTFVMNLSPAGAARVGRTNGIGNVWGLDEQPMIWWQFSTGWDLASDDIRVQTWSRRLTESLHTINRKKGTSSEFVYMGDAGEWQDPFAGFPEANVRRMKAVRAAYDPLRTFSRLNWGGFKLGFD
ncbi:FAD-binding oxidoreductase [Aspergillus fischeri NRRL 181]|uniref:FAD binding domain protein n=1 Tax=Neosartorya fischeri (strain ATCC 1020 / DSM 3700 / CBS 544.65 / FGSC A1164 / JCM 1740 / NRRL 181 / WB 181) TaxID=331117 RepID=A1DKE6_NEOFI|nr:FAD binding domain protein [Aspergillus fischeri NRRL 181]EAW17185.1 FAD binding domain protein [Aspergillus fischeri NRRL 181]